MARFHCSLCIACGDGFYVSFYLRPYHPKETYGSRAPTSGGQYHWVAQFAPARFAASFSWAAGIISLPRIQGPVLTVSTGWVSIFARLAICASAAFVAGQLIVGLIILNVDTYDPLRWHGTMIYWAILLLSVLVNVLGIRIFPHIETAAFIFHICFFFVLLVPLVYLSPQSTARFVFTDFENVGGWSSNGVSWFLGLLTSAWAFVGESIEP